MNTTAPVKNMIRALSETEFLTLANKRTIPHHCDVATPMSKFREWIDNDEGEFVVDMLEAAGLDSRYNVLNYPILEEAMRTSSTMNFKTLGDFSEYMFDVITMHNDKLMGVVTASEVPSIEEEDDDDIGLGEARAGINAVLNGGPKTYKGKRIRGLYLADEDEFLKAHPELEPLKEFKAVTIGEWWKGVYDEGSRESTGELMEDTIGTLPEGYEFIVRYMGDGRFHFIDTIHYEGLMFPKALGDISLHESIETEESIEYLKHFKLV